MMGKTLGRVSTHHPTSPGNNSASPLWNKNRNGPDSTGNGTRINNRSVIGRRGADDGGKVRPGQFVNGSEIGKDGLLRHSQDRRPMRHTQAAQFPVGPAHRVFAFFPGPDRGIRPHGPRRRLFRPVELVSQP